MKDITKKYSNKDITIVWKPSTCIHSTLCWKGEKGLKSVFNPMEKPWIKPEGASTDQIVERIKGCPSGALSFYYNDEMPEEKTTEPAKEHMIEVLPHGPLLVHGNVHVKHKDSSISLKTEVTAFCRCGASGNKPYCDGSHITTGFND